MRLWISLEATSDWRTTEMSVILVDDRGSVAHVGPSRAQPGSLALLVHGREPNAVLEHFRHVTYACGKENMEVGRPSWCPPAPGEREGSWAVLGRIW